jgi:hypothetical protein
MTAIPNLALPGGIVERMVFRCTVDGNRVEDITDVFTGGTVKRQQGTSGDAPAVFTMELIGAERVVPLKDFVTPYVRINYDDESTTGWMRLGVFVTGQPDATITQTTVRKSYPCEDLTAVMRDAAFNDTYKIASGTNIATAIAGIITNAGLVKYQLPNTAKTTGYTRNFPKGMSNLEAANSLCQAAGWWPLYCDRQGVIRTAPSRLLSDSQPLARYTNDDYIGTIQDKPTRGQLGNVVAVRRERSDKSPLYAIRRNTDVDSPISIPNIGREILYSGGWVDATDAEDQDDVDALADRLIEEARSYERTVAMTILPSIDLLDPHRVIDLDIATDHYDFYGRYWVTQAVVGTGPKDVVMPISCNRLVRFRRGEDAEG